MRRYTLEIGGREFVIDVDELAADRFEVIVGERAYEVDARRRRGPARGDDHARVRAGARAGGRHAGARDAGARGDDAQAARARGGGRRAAQAGRRRRRRHAATRRCPA